MPFSLWLQKVIEWVVMGDMKRDKIISLTQLTTQDLCELLPFMVSLVMMHKINMSVRHKKQNIIMSVSDVSFMHC